jgi:hypothetical protein
LGNKASYRRIDSFVVYLANLINVIMAALFTARISGLPIVGNILGIVTIVLGFGWVILLL